MNPSQVIRLEDAVERRCAAVRDGAVLDDDGLRDLPGRPGILYDGLLDDCAWDNVFLYSISNDKLLDVVGLLYAVL